MVNDMPASNQRHQVRSETQENNEDNSMGYHHKT